MDEIADVDMKVNAASHKTKIAQSNKNAMLKDIQDLKNQ
jgi:hypothetical protein